MVLPAYRQVGYVVVNETATHRAAGLHHLLRIPAASVRPSWGPLAEAISTQQCTTPRQCT